MAAIQHSRKCKFWGRFSRSFFGDGENKLLGRSSHSLLGEGGHYFLGRSSRSLCWEHENQVLRRCSRSFSEEVEKRKLGNQVVALREMRKASSRIMFFATFWGESNTLRSSRRSIGEGENKFLGKSSRSLFREGENQPFGRSSLSLFGNVNNKTCGEIRSPHFQERRQLCF